MNNDIHALHHIEVTKVHVGKVKFEICFPNHEQHCREFEAQWENFREKCRRAIPKIGRLDIRPMLDSTRFVQRRVGRNSTYTLHDMIGTGGFGTVCKASDYRTGELFAAKQFFTQKQGWDARAYSEATISQDITHVMTVTIKVV